MKLAKKILLRLFLSLVPSDLKYPTDKELKARRDWLLLSHGNSGFAAWYASRYHGITKALAGGVQRDEDYHILIGRRLELLQLLEEAKTEFDKAEKEKRKK